MLRLSSQSKSTRSLRTAVLRETGICTRPKLIAPFQIARAMAVLLRFERRAVPAVAQGAATLAALALQPGDFTGQRGAPLATTQQADKAHRPPPGARKTQAPPLQ